MQIHYNGNTISDRYPEWVTEEDSIQLITCALSALVLAKCEYLGKCESGELVQATRQLIPINV